MNAAASLFAGLLFACGTAGAQVPESGRAQELSFSAEEVASTVEDRYIDRVVGLAAAGRLDDDRVLLARLQSIGAGLIRAAVALKPEVAGWEWEFHTTSDAEVDAICMAGGKILVGSAFVRQLALSDGELATLLGHEVAHAVAEHHRETLSEALFGGAAGGGDGAAGKRPVGADPPVQTIQHAGIGGGPAGHGAGPPRARPR